MLEISRQVPEIFRNLKFFKHMLETTRHTPEILGNLEICYVIW